MFKNDSNDSGSSSPDTLSDILSQDKVLFKTRLTNGREVTFNMEVLTGEKLIKARKIIADHHIPEEQVKDTEPETLINQISSMYRELYKLVVQFPDSVSPTDESIDRVVTLSGGVGSDLSKKVMQCAGLGGTELATESDPLEDLPS